MKTMMIEKPPEIEQDLELAGAYFFNDGGGTVYLFKSTMTNEWYEFVWKSKAWTKVKLVNAPVPQDIQLVE
jgi:hypothetical protein